MTATTFTALDFETAHHERFSICQVGLVRYEAGAKTRELNLLVRPPANYFLESFTAIHGIRPEDTAASPTFVEIWPQVAPFISGQRVVAHNGHSFDFDVLRKTLIHYNLSVPVFEGICTYQIYHKKLSVLCAEHAIALNHHDALSDAHARAQLYLKSLGVRQGGDK